MYTGKRFRPLDVFFWTKRETTLITLIATLPSILVAGLGWTWLSVPWVPIAMLGTASAFTVGFRNNATYARTWEARQIWGASSMQVAHGASWHAIWSPSERIPP